MAVNVCPEALTASTPSTHPLPRAGVHDRHHEPQGARRDQFGDRVGAPRPALLARLRRRLETVRPEVEEQPHPGGDGHFPPLPGPAFVVVAIWQFTQIWNELLFAVTLTRPNAQPVTVACPSPSPTWQGAGGLLEPPDRRLDSGRAAAGARIYPGETIVYAGAPGGRSGAEGPRRSW